jgi:predicted TPR repeat methyltransferase
MKNNTDGAITPSSFDYDYFDNPRALGYRGYSAGGGDYQCRDAWNNMARFCASRGVTTAIDMGCAKGYLVQALQRAGIACVGYDVSEYALSFASSLPCFKHDIRFGVPGKADALFCLGVLLYLEKDTLSAVLLDIYRATGRFFLFSAYYREQAQSVPDPLRRITESRSWWRRTIKNVGFKFESSEEYFDVYRKALPTSGRSRR